MSPAAPLVAALIAAVAGPGEGPQGVVRPVLTPLPARVEHQPVITPLPAADDLGARVLARAALRDRPGGRIVARVAPKTQFGSPTVVPVIHRRGRWLGVIAPELPNGQVGWMPADGVDFVHVPVRLRVSLSERVLQVVVHGRTVARMTVGIGSATTPTPTGWFAVTDGLRGWGPYGCCILALSGHQPKLAQGWTGGDRLAVHGTPAADTIGTPSSLGCLRADAADLHRLMRIATLGTRVHIEA
jgi:lipoprotein-anchoring transpeptidase ErfK/SrfK